MNMTELAKLAVEVWDSEIAISMLAIARAESALDENAEGDSPNILTGLGYPQSATKAATFNCPLGDPDGAASIGLFQIFMPVWHDALASDLGAPNTPCELADWLKVPENSVLAADLVYRQGGFTQWATYDSPVYYKYLGDARNAVESALQPSTSGAAGINWPAVLIVAAIAWASLSADRRIP